MDLISLSIRGALANTEVPRLSIVYNQLQDTYEYELQPNKEEQAFQFDVSSVPLIVTIGELDQCLVIDQTRSERETLKCHYIVTANRTNIFSVNKIGLSDIEAEDIFKVLNLGQDIAKKKIQHQDKVFR